MTKSILFAFALGLFAVTSMGISTSANACANCAQHKPCEKCVKAGKPCKCKGAKPCEKTLGKKAPCEKCASKKPCTKCADKKPCEKKLGKKKPCTKKLKSRYDHSSKGSLTIRSGSSFTSGGTSSYNE